MSRLLFAILLLVSLNNYGQKSQTEALINQIAANEVPENFEYYFLVSQSLAQPKIYDSLQNYQIRELKMFDKDFPLNLIYKQIEEIIDWKNYDLNNTKYVNNEYNYQTTSPPTNKKVQFVKYNIPQKEYDSLLKNKKPHTLIVKKKWFWSKKRIWKNKKFNNELKKAWKKDEQNNREDKVYFQFSKPVFSKDEKYARVSIFKNRRCNGSEFTALYKNENGIWRKLIEYNQQRSITISSHVRCEDILAISYE